MKRPYIVCHMVTSMDGKVTGDFLNKEKVQPACDVYYEINRNYKADAFVCGRVTMESSFTGGYEPDLENYQNQEIERVDFVVDSDTDYYAVAFDKSGKLGWVDSKIYDEDPGYDNAHIIEVLCEEVNDAYLAYLQDIQVSYIFAGEKDIDIEIALHKLRELFGIKTLMLEGGSIINASFQNANVIDELSLVMASVVGDREDKSLFETSIYDEYTLKEVKEYDHGVLWLNYIK